MELSVDSWAYGKKKRAVTIVTLIWIVSESFQKKATILQASCILAASNVFTIVAATFFGLLTGLIGAFEPMIEISLVQTGRKY